MDRAHRRVGPLLAVGLFFKNFGRGGGRSSRGAYWWSRLFYLLSAVPLIALDITFWPQVTYGLFEQGPLDLTHSFALLIPTIAVGVRRLHDINKSAWWILLELVVVGLPLIWWWASRPGTAGPNRFGPDLEAGQSA